MNDAEALREIEALLAECADGHISSIRAVNLIAAVLNQAKGIE